jgi:hypothetical protein
MVQASEKDNKHIPNTTPRVSTANPNKLPHRHGKRWGSLTHRQPTGSAKHKLFFNIGISQQPSKQIFG